MSWVKQSDTLWRDYRFTKLTDGAQALWHRANSWIADQLSDGHIPETAIKSLSTRKRYVDELEAAGYWVRQPTGGWLADGWQEIIESKAVVLARRTQSIQRAAKSRAAHVRERCAPPGPGPGPSSVLLNSRDDLKTSSCASASDARAAEVRFEKPPIPEAPPNVPPSNQQHTPWLTAWKITTRTCGTDGQAGHPSRHREWLDAIVCAAEKDCGCTEGPKFERAVEAIVRAWLADPYVVEKRPRMSNIQVFLEKRALRPKPVVKLAPAQPAAGSGAALLDWHEQIARAERAAAGGIVRGDDDRTQALRDAVNVPVTARDPLAAFHLKLAMEGTQLDISRQVFADRVKLEPVAVPPPMRFSEPGILDRWRKGAAIPDTHKDEFAAWMVNHTTRRMAQSENERRLRASMTAQRALAQSDQECDRRQASAFGRWHLEHWRLADIPAWAPAGEEQPFELQLKAALGRLPR